MESTETRSKVMARTPEAVRGDMDAFRKYIRDFAESTRQIQPTDLHE